MATARDFILPILNLIPVILIIYLVPSFLSKELLKFMACQTLLLINSRFKCYNWHLSDPHTYTVCQTDSCQLFVSNLRSLELCKENHKEEKHQGRERVHVRVHVCACGCAFMCVCVCVCVCVFVCVGPVSVMVLVTCC